MNDVRSTLDLALASEPPLAHGLDDVVAAGRSVRRRRRAVRVAGSVASVVAVVAVAGVVASGPRQPDRVTQPAAAPASASASSVAPSPAAPPLSPQQQVVADTIRAASPQGWTFELGRDRFVGTPERVETVEATADDGAGPGRLMIGFSTATQLLHPCRDAEFARNATCVERALADGSVLTLRGVAQWQGAGAIPTTTVMVVLTHPDGSGIAAESGDYTITWPIRPGKYTPEQKRALVHHSRTGPTYTVDQLADVVLALESAVSGAA
jgi:hypothetical protein